MTNPRSTSFGTRTNTSNREVPVSEGDEARSLSQEEIGQGQEDHGLFSHGSTCTTSVFPKDTDYV